jgi:hypothetical protein
MVGFRGIGRLITAQLQSISTDAGQCPAICRGETCEGASEIIAPLTATHVDC